jgi:hypothetical protein
MFQQYHLADVTDLTALAVLATRMQSAMASPVR